MRAFPAYAPAPGNTTRITGDTLVVCRREQPDQHGQGPAGERGHPRHRRCRRAQYCRACRGGWAAGHDCVVGGVTHRRSVSQSNENRLFLAGMGIHDQSATILGLSRQSRECGNRWAHACQPDALRRCGICKRHQRSCGVLLLA